MRVFQTTISLTSEHENGQIKKTNLWIWRYGSPAAQSVHIEREATIHLGLPSSVVWNLTFVVGGGGGRGGGKSRFINEFIDERVFVWRRWVVSCFIAIYDDNVSDDDDYDTCVQQSSSFIITICLTNEQNRPIVLYDLPTVCRSLVTEGGTTKQSQATKF